MVCEIQTACLQALKEVSNKLLYLRVAIIVQRKHPISRYVRIC